MSPVMSIVQNSHEVLVIGGGPAGLAAATSLARACRRVAVFDSHEYRNDVTDQIHNVLIHDGQHPERFRALARREIENLFETVTFVETTIIRAWTFKTRDSRHEFKVRDQNGTIYRGKKLILASGSVDILPDIPGFQDLWGDIIVHGIFCDGFEKRGKTAGVLGLSSLDDLAPTLMAYFLSQNDLTIYTNGEDPSKYRFQDNLDMALARGCRLDSRKIRNFTRMQDDSIMIQFRHGGVSHLGFLMYTPRTRNRAQNLIYRLGIQTSHHDGYAMAMGPHGQTNVRGCFVAGDTSTVNKSVATALSSGMIAGTGAARQLAIDEGLAATHPRFKMENEDEDEEGDEDEDDDDDEDDEEY